MKKNIKFTIYQLPFTEENALRLYRSIDESEMLVDLNYEGYKKIYTSSIEGPDDYGEIAVLDVIFELLNLHHPKDYISRSLSVSDIVQLGDNYYHCQSMGWKKIERVSIERFVKRCF